MHYYSSKELSFNAAVSFQAPGSLTSLRRRDEKRPFKDKNNTKEYIGNNGVREPQGLFAEG